MRYFQFSFPLFAWTDTRNDHCDGDYFLYDIFADKLSEAKKIAFSRFRIDFLRLTGLKFPLTINELDDICDYCEVKCKASS